MNFKKSKPSKKILRIFGVLLGVAFVIGGIWIPNQSNSDGILDKLSSFSVIILGVAFFIYGITGRSNIYEKKE